MKKLISLVLVFMLVFCCAMAEAVDVTGEWFLTTIQMGDAAMDPAMLGMEITMTLNADGSAAMNALGEESSGSWRQEGEKYILEDEAPMELSLVDGALVTAADESGVVMVFEREASAPAVVSVRTGVTAEEFNGSWIGTEAEMLGMRMPMEMMGMEMKLDIADGLVTIVVVEEGAEEKQEGEASLQDDALVMSDPSGSENPLSLYLMDDGSLAIIQAAEGMELRMYFEKVAAE